MLARDVAQALREENISLPILRATSRECVVFGSRAAGVASPSSDWDILVVGNLPGEPPDSSPVRRHQWGNLDLVVVVPEHTTTLDWLESELANHISEYGKWLWGDLTWKHEAYIGDRTLDAKTKALKRQWQEIRRTTGYVAPLVTRLRLVRWRCDAQRLNCILHHEAAPPTRVLHHIWDQLTPNKRATIISKAGIYARIPQSELRSAYGQD